MKTLQAALLVLALALAGLCVPAASAQEVVRINSDTYAAIAYSPSTQHFGYAWDCGTLDQARRMALARCNEDDAKVLTWVQFGFAALVIADDGAYAYAEVHGAGTSGKDAFDEAKAELRKVTDSPIKTILIVCSGDVDPIVINRTK
jgi:hypothetical protein